MPSGYCGGAFSLVGDLGGRLPAKVPAVPRLACFGFFPSGMSACCNAAANRVAAEVMASACLCSVACGWPSEFSLIPSVPHSTTPVLRDSFRLHSRPEKRSTPKGRKCGKPANQRVTIENAKLSSERPWLESFKCLGLRGAPFDGRSTLGGNGTLTRSLNHYESSAYSEASLHKLTGSDGLGKLCVGS